MSGPVRAVNLTCWNCLDDQLLIFLANSQLLHCGLFDQDRISGAVILLGRRDAAIIAAKADDLPIMGAWGP
jgi:hypothetical protein